MFYKRRRFNDVDEAKSLIEEYFTQFDKEEKDKCPSIVGLAVFLGISTPTLYNYRNKSMHKDYNEMFENAVTYIEECTVNKGFQGNTFANFMLSRKHKYIEKSELDIKDKTSIVDKLSAMTDEELEELAHKELGKRKEKE